ncbi:flagellar basal body P-ring formation chaperone FlgA [Zavarzinia sp. CC-PAN008]|uniref:flagellar basal body P-ring formation chaperone FlgA n=1 Tax=Zavarzinia sp. CC-PAN008 TaxID=3243332 RepID=UPI003F747E5D
MRASLAALAVALLLPGLADAATLRASVEVDAPMVTLADLIADAPLDVDLSLAVGAAPQPGRRAVFSGQQVLDLAKAAGIGIDGTVPRAITVARSGRAVPQAELQARVADALLEAGAELADVRQIQFNANDRAALQVARDAEPVASVESVDWDAQTGRFVAQVRLEGMERAVPVAGRTIRVAQLPVLRAAVAMGQVIGDAEIDYVEVPAYRVSRVALLDAGQIVGQAARRPLRPGVALTANDLRRPVVIAKGSLVTMVVQAAAMTLTATGKAMEDGGQGDLIRIQNPSSNKIVQGKVTGPDRVEVVIAANIIN